MCFRFLQTSSCCCKGSVEHLPEIKSSFPSSIFQYFTSVMKMRTFISEFSAKSNVSGCSYSYIGVFKILVSQIATELHFPTDFSLPCPSVFPQKSLCRAWVMIIAVDVLAATSRPGYPIILFITILSGDLCCLQVPKGMLFPNM